MDMLVLAGASFPCGVSDLGDVARRHGFDPLYLDHPHNAASVEPGLPAVRCLDHLPEEVIKQEGMFIPLLESWVSEGRKIPESARMQFDSRAASISRSKIMLSEMLGQSGIPCVPRRRVESIEQALSAGTEWGYPIVLRADTGYSGRGVWIANSREELKVCWRKQSEERTEADYAEMRAVMDTPRDTFIVEPWMSGEEWSLDCIVCPAGTHLIRVCQKATTIMEGRPFTLGYRIVDAPDVLRSLQKAVVAWSRELFLPRKLSFACFDIRLNSHGDFVPIDFGVRLGSDRIPLLVRRAAGSKNPYASALDAALSSDPSRICAVESGFALIHAFAQQCGVFEGITLSRAGEVIHSRPPGFCIKRGQGTHLFRRVGTVLCSVNGYDDFREACLTSADWIRVQYR